jgi:hypothetical protein
MSDSLHERNDSLWWVGAAPAIWGGHFLLSYGTAAVWCAKQGHDAPLASARVAIVVYTGVALAAVLVVALRGVRAYRATRPRPRTGSDTREARHQFLGFTLLSLSGLSALALVYEALAVAFIGSCQ